MLTVLMWKDLLLAPSCSQKVYSEGIIQKLTILMFYNFVVCLSQTVGLLLLVKSQVSSMQEANFKIDKLLVMSQ